MSTRYCAYHGTHHDDRWFRGLHGDVCTEGAIRRQARALIARADRIEAMRRACERRQEQAEMELTGACNG